MHSTFIFMATLLHAHRLVHIRITLRRSDEVLKKPLIKRNACIYDVVTVNCE